jgi:hypothetical protein
MCQSSMEENRKGSTRWQQQGLTSACSGARQAQLKWLGLAERLYSNAPANAWRYALVT